MIATMLLMKKAARREKAAALLTNSNVLVLVFVSHQPGNVMGKKIVKMEVMNLVKPVNFNIPYVLKIISDVQMDVVFFRLGFAILSMIVVIILMNKHAQIVLLNFFINVHLIRSLVEMLLNNAFLYQISVMENLIVLMVLMKVDDVQETYALPIVLVVNTNVITHQMDQSVLVHLANNL
jgi:hypothetical protein